MLRSQKFVALTLVLGLLVPAAHAQEAAVVSGTVTGEGENAPIPGVSIFIEELQGQGIGTTTGADGTYTLRVPAEEVEGQTVTLVAQFVGYKAMRRDITLSEMQQEQNFSLARDVLKREEVVVTGVAGPTDVRKIPFDVESVGQEELERVAPVGNPASALQARVPGVQVVGGQGTPGQSPSIQLRGVTSITQGQGPLYIVDGAFMSGTVDLDALDVKNIEVVKGAAAASLYGSQAANGVIRITTKSGEGLAEGATNIRVRNEFGFNQLNSPNQHGRYHDQMVARTSFTDPNGNEVEPGDWLRQESDGTRYKADWNTASREVAFNGVSFQDNEYPVFNDHLEAIFKEGMFLRNNIAVSRRMEDTNFRLSFGNVQEEGVVSGARGYTRRNLRANIDHDVWSNLQLRFRGYYSNSDRDDPTTMSGGTNIWPAPYFISPAVSLTERDEEGEYPVQPDQTTRYENPLYAVNNSELSIRRERATATVTGDYDMLSWLNFQGRFSYKAYNGDTEQFYDQGYETSQPSSLNGGYYEVSNGNTRSWDASLRASYIQSFGALNTRTQFKVLGEKSEYQSSSVSGSGFAAQGVKDIDNIPQDQRSSGSYQNDTRSLYGFVQTQLDYDGRYIGNFLIRRDGSSRFGEDERWNTYYRLSGSYRISEEAWWPFENALNEFKLRYSLATAGTQPGFGAKFETYNVGGGRISKVTQGNPDLQPEKQTEQSMGVDFSLFDRVSGQFTYATSTVEDQLLQVPLPGNAGFNTQWRNAGTVESYSLEGKLDASLVQQGDITWTAGVNISHSRSTIVEFGRTPFRTGQDDIFRIEEGVEFGTYFGNRYIRDKSDLPERWQPYADQFAVNDEGWIVPVGEGNSWRDGISEQLWGTEVDIDGDGEPDADWGEPVQFESEGGEDVAIGSSVPDFNLGFNTNLEWNDFSVFALFGAQVGGDVYNFNRHWAGNNHNMTDQAGKSDATKKPNSYFNAFGAFNNRYVEDGSYLKLRELAIGYTFDSDALVDVLGQRAGSFIDQVELSLVGRNLLTFTGYSGYDPEVGQGNSALLRIDYFSYPNYRTFTGKIAFTL